MRRVAATFVVSTTLLFAGFLGPPASATSSNSVLHGFAAVSSSDVWATGYSVVGTGVAHTLAEHWNGSSWQIVSTPSPGTRSDFLNQASALGSDNVWVVGTRDNRNPSQGPGSHTLIENWNGTAWNVVSSPNVSGANQNVLRGAAAVSASDVWAGGYFKISGSPRQTLIEHWNGSAWKIVSSPNASSDQNGIDQLAAVSTSDVWAVGSFSSNGTPHSLTEHWNGSSWQIVPSPSPGTGGAYPEGTLLWSASAVASNDVWAVGQYYDGTAIRTLTIHWDGSRWTQISSPNVGLGENQLRGIAVLASNNVWAVGWSNVGGTYRTLIEHWDGTAWSLVPSQDVGTGDNYLKGIAAVSPSDIWAGAYDTSSGTYQTLIQHWDGSSWSVVPSPNA